MVQDGTNINNIENRPASRGLRGFEPLPCTSRLEIVFLQLEDSGHLLEDMKIPCPARDHIKRYKMIA